ncbi:hypothetical protein EGW08_010940 [Elysia chlorotica]|uniref:Integrase zinc-binding domain-containing protein n=1 Tax=Elysia chlorotica TaxID=188477 RepID=A0A3S1C2R7_ELYCH|nr:hypothetical protein EGW08_010940 [Elysia chlorotica]
MLNKLHKRHLGVTKCCALAHTSVWWPNISPQIEYMVNKCSTCATLRPPMKEPLLPFSFHEHPLSRVAVDLFDLLGKTCLLLFDYHFRWQKLRLLDRITGSSTSNITRLRSVFATHGIPDIAVSASVFHLPRVQRQCSTCPGYSVSVPPAPGTASVFHLPRVQRQCSTCPGYSVSVPPAPGTALRHHLPRVQRQCSTCPGYSVSVPPEAPPVPGTASVFHLRHHLPRVQRQCSTCPGYSVLRHHLPRVQRQCSTCPGYSVSVPPAPGTASVFHLPRVQRQCSTCPGYSVSVPPEAPPAPGTASVFHLRHHLYRVQQDRSK